MTVPSPNTFRSADLLVKYYDVPNEIPQITSVIFKKRNLVGWIQETIFSTLLGTKKYLPHEEFVHVDPNFKTLAYQYFDEMVKLEKAKRDLAVGCTDFFFNNVCVLYWNLIANGGSKNLAIAFLEEICSITDKWEKKKTRIHKGTPYFFLTFGFLEEGDIDSAFATMFEAVNEDRESKDPILGTGSYKKSPAYKYVSLVDDRKNYLYDSIFELRNLVKGHITKFNKASRARPKFTMRTLDTRFLQSDDTELEQIKYLFTYCLEKNRKYRKQLPTLPNNDFYKIGDANFFFNLCLITDKILETRYKQTFRSHVKRRDMTMNDGIALLFEDKGWIGKLTSNQKKDPRTSLRIRPNLPKNDPKELVDKLFLNPVRLTCNTRPFNFEMRVMQLAVKLRNYAGHNIRKQDVFVKNYPQIVEWLFSSIFIAVSTLPAPKKSAKKSKIPQPPKSTATIISQPTTYSTTTTTSSSQSVVTSLPSRGTIGFEADIETNPETIGT